MDWLAVFVVVAVVAQLCLPLVSAWERRSSARLAKRRADLLEAAADQQAVATFSQTAKLGSKGAGHE